MSAEAGTVVVAGALVVVVPFVGLSLQPSNRADARARATT
jgi:hypothetical protein